MFRLFWVYHMSYDRRRRAIQEDVLFDRITSDRMDA